jgi:hypothetical protein
LGPSSLERLCTSNKVDIWEPLLILRDLALLLFLLLLLPHGSSSNMPMFSIADPKLSVSAKEKPRFAHFNNVDPSLILKFHHIPNHTPLLPGAFVGKENKRCQSLPFAHPS